MAGRHKHVTRLYGAIALFGIAFGLWYLLRGTFMAYHAAAIGKTWEQVDGGTQVLLLALMRVAGGGLIAVGILVLAILYFVHTEKNRWARHAVPAGLLALHLTTLYATLSVQIATPASPPWYGAALACAAIVAAFLVDAPWREGHDPDAGEAR